MGERCICLVPWVPLTLHCPGHGLTECKRKRQRGAEFSRRWREMEKLKRDHGPTCRAWEVPVLAATTEALWPTPQHLDGEATP